MLTQMNESQRDAMHEALSANTVCYSADPRDVKERELFIHALDSAVAQSDAHPITKVRLGLSDSRIEGCGRGTGHRELLFRELAHILCPGDVEEWTETRLTPQGALEPYQDATHMAYSWRSYALGKKFRFYTVSARPEPGFTRTIAWSILIVNWRLNEQAKARREREALELEQLEQALRESVAHLDAD